MECVCHGEVCLRVEVLIQVRDGRAREDDHGQGNRREHCRDCREALRRRAGAFGDSVMDAGRVHRPWYAVYESDCTGFHLCREPRALGVDCDIVVVASIARSDSDRKRKNNRRDAWAGRIERCLAADTTVSQRMVRVQQSG